MNKIAGPVLCGFGDFFEEAPQIYLGAVGAPPAKAGTVKVQSGIKVRVPPPGKSPHQLALTASVTAGGKAVAVAKQAAAKVAQYKKNVKARKHGPIVPVTPTKVKGDGTVVLGVAAPVAKVLTPKQKSAVEAHTKAIAATAKATRRLNAAAQKAARAGSDAKTFSGQAAAFIAKKLEGGKKAAVKPPTATRVRGVEEILGDILGDAVPLDDPSTWVDQWTEGDITNQQGMGGLDQSSGVVYAPDGSVLYDPNQDPELIAVPDRPARALTREEAVSVWKEPPADGVVYDGSRGFPEDSVGTTSLFYDGKKDGVIWSPSKARWGLNSLIGSRDTKKLNNQWTRLGPESGVLGPAGHKGAWRWFETGLKSALDAKNALALARQYNFGLLVGDPNNEVTKGLQFASDTGQWFWQWDTAPKWAVTEADTKILEANKKTISAKQAAAIAQAAAILQQQAADAEAQRKRDAELALAEEQRQEQLKNLDVEAQKGDLDIAKQQAQIDLQAQQAQLEIAKQQAATQAAQQQALIEQTSQWNAFAMQNPQQATQVLPTLLQPGGNTGIVPPQYVQQQQYAPQQYAQPPQYETVYEEAYEEYPQPVYEEYASYQEPYPADEYGEADPYAAYGDDIYAEDEVYYP